MGKETCKKWEPYKEPDPKSILNTHCTEKEDENNEVIEVAFFCGSRVTVNQNNFCDLIGDNEGELIEGNFKAKEWENVNMNTNSYNYWKKSGRNIINNKILDFNDFKLAYDNDNCHFATNQKVAGGTVGRKVEGHGCCNGCGIWGGTGKFCKRKKYNADPIVCCMNDNDNLAERLLNRDACWQSSRRQRTCDPDFRNLGSKNCGDLLQDYCIGNKTLPNQKNWKQLWAKDGSIDFNYKLQEEIDNTDKDLSKVVEQPCLKILVRQLVGNLKFEEGFEGSGGMYISSWEELKIKKLLYSEFSENGKDWTEYVIDRIFDRYVKENFGNFFPSIGKPGYVENSSFLETLYDICYHFPFLCKNNLKSICRGYTVNQIKENPAILKWCGCYFSDEVYSSYINKFAIPIECTPYCNRDDVIPSIDQKNNVNFCTQSICVIDDINIEITNSQNPGGINFSQLCNGCGLSKIDRNYDTGEIPTYNDDENGVQEGNTLPLTILQYIQIESINNYWIKLNLTKGNLSGKDKSTSLLNHFIDNDFENMYKGKKDGETYYLVAGIPWDLFAYRTCSDSDANSCSFEDTGDGGCNPRLGDLGYNLGKKLKIGDNFLDAGIGIFWCNPNSKNENTKYLIPREFYWQDDKSTGYYTGTINLRMVPLHLFEFDDDYENEYNDKKIKEYLKKYLVNQEIPTNIDENYVRLPKDKEDTTKLGIYNIKINDSVYLYDISNICTSEKNMSSYKFWDVINFTTKNMLKFGNGVNVIDINRCDCKLSGSFQITNSYLGELNIEENCIKKECYNSLGEVIPCGAACYDDTGNITECSRLGLSDYTKSNITTSYNNNASNPNSRYFIWVLTFIFIILISLLIYKLFR